MKLCIIGDIHGDFKTLENILQTTEADLYLQVGDLVGSRFGEREEYIPLTKPIYFVAGNHENWDDLEKYVQLSQDFIPQIRENLFFIPTAHYLTYKGIRIVGFGGNLSEKRFNYKRSQLQHDRRRHYTHYDFERTLNLNRCDILLTHEAPSPFEHRGDDAGSPHITSIINTLLPKYHFFGHMHYYREQELSGCKSYCIPIHDYRIFEV